jgi:hypothetical protein
VEFLALGVGWNTETGLKEVPFPGSSRRVSTGPVSLSQAWTKFAIDLRGVDLSYVLGGFGWVASASNSRNTNITFFVDDVSYDKPRLDEPRLLLSYETAKSELDFDIILRNVAFTYDNAVALQAFLASGQVARAQFIADALVWVQDHDRYYSDGRIRNAYKAGPISLPPGWSPNGKAATASMPGWYDASLESWLEDEFAVSTHTGNVAWAMLGLLTIFEATAVEKYLRSAQRMGEWVEVHCKDSRGAGGYTAGYEGWEPNPTQLLYKSTEHNLDLFSAFRRLFEATGDQNWLDRATHAGRFLEAMWDERDMKFWTGTGVDGVTVNQDTIPLDGQSWGALALGSQNGLYLKGLNYAEQEMRVGPGFDFNQDKDAVWHEGTAKWRWPTNWPDNRRFGTSSSRTSIRHSIRMEDSTPRIGMV